MVCPYTIQIFNCMSKRFDLRISWTNNSLLDNLDNWLSRILVNSHLPFFIIWCIWISRNWAIFYSRDVATSTTCHHILSLMNAYPTSLKPPKIKVVGLTPVLRYPYGFFDGVVANTIGGASIQLAISLHHCYSLKMGFGLSSNTRA